VLLADDQSGRQVRDAHCRVRRVHTLSTWTRRAEDVDAKVFVFDFDVDLLRFRQDGHGRRRRVDAALALGFWNALHAMDARLPTEVAVRCRANDLEYDFFKAAERRVGQRHDLHAPAAALDVA